MYSDYKDPILNFAKNVPVISPDANLCKPHVYYYYYPLSVQGLDESQEIRIYVLYVKDCKVCIKEKNEKGGTDVDVLPIFI